MGVIKKRKSGFRRTWGCPRTKNRSNWCYRLCTPVGLIGDCGKVAQHAMLSRIQKAILAQKLREEQEKKTA